MLQDFFDKLKTEWENLRTNTEEWVSHLEGRYSGSSTKDTRTTKESIERNKGSLTSRLTNISQRLQQDNPTLADILGMATRVQAYLDETQDIHQEFTKYSSGDSQTEKDAEAVQNARIALNEQVKGIYGSTTVQSAATDSSADVAPLPSSPSQVRPGTTRMLGSGSYSGGGGGSPAPDELFWLEEWLKHQSLPTLAKDAILNVTKKLLDGPLSTVQDLKTLNGEYIGLQNLVDDWGAAVQSLFAAIKNANNTGTECIISVLVFIRNQLQTLYSNLLITVTQQQPLARVGQAL